MDRAAYLLYGVCLQAAASSNATTLTGILRLGLSSGGRDGYVFVPSSYRQSAPCALIVVLHGAGKGGLDGLGVLFDQANSSGAHCCTVSVSKACLVACGSFAPFLGCLCSECWQCTVTLSSSSTFAFTPSTLPTLGSGPQCTPCKLLLRSFATTAGCHAHEPEVLRRHHPAGAGLAERDLGLVCFFELRRGCGVHRHGARADARPVHHRPRAPGRAGFQRRRNVRAVPGCAAATASLWEPICGSAGALGSSIYLTRHYMSDTALPSGVPSFARHALSLHAWLAHIAYHPTSENMWLTFVLS